MASNSLVDRNQDLGRLLLLLLLLLLLTAMQFSLGGSSPYTSTGKTNNIRKQNNIKTQ